MQIDKKDLLEVIESFDRLLKRLNKSSDFHYGVWKDNEICKLTNYMNEHFAFSNEKENEKVKELYLEYAQNENEFNRKNIPVDLWNMGQWEAYGDAIHSLDSKIWELKELVDPDYEIFTEDL
tara:strand:+ start:1360 stop:1725 length:366 start_codon:yes stop_codon:yes gene_type:complete